MAIFTRRALQQCLDDLSDLLPRTALAKWVKRLNRVRDDYASDEWEIVLLRSFSKLGRVTHEAATGGRKTLDIAFVSNDDRVSFVAEITAISDKGLHDANPVGLLEEQLYRKYIDAALPKGGFALSVDEMRPYACRGSNRKRQLLLPRAKDFDRIVFDGRFDFFLAELRKAPEQVRTHVVKSLIPPVSLSIRYDPNLTGTYWATYGAFTETTVIDKNPLYNALSTKAKKLEESDSASLKGIIICDSGARVLSAPNNWSSYSKRDVTLLFLDRHRFVDFVLVLTVGSIRSRSGRLAIEPELFALESRPAISELGNVMWKALDLIPQPVQTAENAIRDLRHFEGDIPGHPLNGGWTLHGGVLGMTKVSMSTRALLELLAGRISHEQFRNRFTLNGDSSIFEQQLKLGKMIKGASIRYQPDEDDDEITLEFGETDPAISKFVIPAQKNGP